MKFYFTTYRKFALLIALISNTLVQQALAQPLNSSPYTRYGIGQIEDPVTTVFFGNGLTTAQSNYFNLNIANPASYASLLKHNPVFNVDVNETYSKYSTTSAKSSSNVVGLKSFAMGLPIAKRTGLAFGTTPFSTMGYDITTHSSIDGYGVDYKYYGSGSVNKAFLGIGYNILNKGDTSKFSIGVNANYLFGTLAKQRDVVFENTTYDNSKAYEDERVSGFKFDFGVQYYQKINKKSSFRYGATLSLPTNLNVKQDFYAYNFYYYSGTLIEVPTDTVSYYNNKTGVYKLPRTFSTGVAYQFGGKWTLGVQYDIQNWNQLTKTIESQGVPLTALSQSTKLTAGIEFEPTTEKGDKNKNIFQKSTYRLGAFTGNQGLTIDSTMLKNYGITFGTSIPLISSSSLSSLNFGFAYGKMGTTENNLIQQNYFTFRIGLSLMPNMRFDRWFMKRKYD